MTDITIFNGKYMKSIYFCMEYTEYTFNSKSKRHWRIDGKYEPFVYIIQELGTGMMYIGSRTRYSPNPCLESDLGTKYFTSSKEFNWKSNLDSFEICKIIPCASNHDAIILENIMIEETNAVFDNKYYNKSRAGKTFNVSGIEMPRGYKRPEHSKRMMGKNNPCYNKKGYLHPKYNIGLTEIQSKKCKEGCLNKEKLLCAHCDRYIEPGNYSRWHGINCKYNPDRKHIKLVCPYCGKEGQSSGMKRWHFANCKEKYND